MVGGSMLLKRFRPGTFFSANSSLHRNQMRSAALGEENSQFILTMKNQIPSRFLATSALALAAFASLVPLNALAAQRSGKFTGARNGTLERDVTRQPGSVEKSSTYTSPA